ncbi:hypothetical protein Sjap_016002 [Stephania japonica]|uniref:Uncharacterized protein n=1 Tax=Stephania japonica TaxID=461633 RepID=A0AAP0NTC6_9MAGN
MGNCQAIDAASLVIQHPSGRVERLYWPVTVSEVMRTNRGHYVALVIALQSPNSASTTAASDSSIDGSNRDGGGDGGLRITRVKLLRPTDTMVLGQAYRLITTEEVMKGLREKKYAKMMKKKEAAEIIAKSQDSSCDSDQEQKCERNRPNRQQGTQSSASAARPKTWRPSLQSISESAS